MYEFFFGGSLVNPPLVYELGALAIVVLIGVPLSLWLKSRRA